MSGLSPANSKADSLSPPDCWRLRVSRPSRRCGLKDLELEDEAAQAVENTCDDPEVATTKKVPVQRCVSDWAELSPEHREIVDRVYPHEKSVEEVAEIVGIPENTVRTRLFYARKKLAGLLKAAGVEQG
jgi:RNA polymerase sigma-70 factor, ECF subfamily